MAGNNAVVLRQYRDLVKTIESFSSGQAFVGTGDDDNYTIIPVTIAPSDGPYRGGKFDFEIDVSDSEYPTTPPSILCKTAIYHPNIECEEGSGEVCLNLLDELWSSDMTLEDVVQGILFLFYNPNVEDPLSSMFDGGEDYDDFVRNVRKSLRGETVEGVDFPRNLPEDYEPNSLDEDTSRPRYNDGNDENQNEDSDQSDVELSTKDTEQQAVDPAVVVDQLGTPVDREACPEAAVQLRPSHITSLSLFSLVWSRVSVVVYFRLASFLKNITHRQFHNRLVVESSVDVR